MIARGINRRLQINITESLRLRFANNIGPQLENGCIEWQACQRNGYGCIRHEKKCYSAHRIAWALAGNEFQDGCILGHKCDNKICCNVEHLECITIQKNNIDCFVRRTRERPSGALCPNTVVDAETAERIVELYVHRKRSYRKIARLLGVDQWAVKKIIDGKTWPHLPRKDGMKIPIRQLAEKR